MSKQYVEWGLSYLHPQRQRASVKGTTRRDSVPTAGGSQVLRQKVSGEIPQAVLPIHLDFAISLVVMAISALVILAFCLE